MSDFHGPQIRRDDCAMLLLTTREPLLPHPCLPMLCRLHSRPRRRLATSPGPDPPLYSIRCSWLQEQGDFSEPLNNISAQK